MPHAEIIESATATEGQTMLVGVHNYLPKEGTALLTGSTALLPVERTRRDDRRPHDEEMAILVARALVPYTG